MLQIPHQVAPLIQILASAVHPDKVATCSASCSYIFLGLTATMIDRAESWYHRCPCTGSCCHQHLRSKMSRRRPMEANKRPRCFQTCEFLVIVNAMHCTSTTEMRALTGYRTYRKSIHRTVLRFRSPTDRRVAQSVCARASSQHQEHLAHHKYEVACKDNFAITAKTQPRRTLSSLHLSRGPVDIFLPQCGVRRMMINWRMKDAYVLQQL